VGPGAYTVKLPVPGAQFSFGSRFDSDIRSKDHLKPKKDPFGPAPGLYGRDDSGDYRNSLPGSIKVHKRAMSWSFNKFGEKQQSLASTMDCTFGKGKRDLSNTLEKKPAPNAYNLDPNHHRPLLQYE
jgi:hypothetical protein